MRFPDIQIPPTGPSRILLPSSVFPQIVLFILLIWKPGFSRGHCFPLWLFPMVLFFSYSPDTNGPGEEEVSSLSLNSTFRPWSSLFPKHLQSWISGCYITFNPSSLHSPAASRTRSLTSGWGQVLAYYPSSKHYSIPWQFQHLYEWSFPNPGLSVPENSFLQWSCPPPYYGHSFHTLV